MQIRSSLSKVYLCCSTLVPLSSSHNAQITKHKQQAALNYNAQIVTYTKIQHGHVTVGQTPCYVKS